MASGTAGATITAGQAIYLDSSTSTLKLCDADASVTAAACVGVALHASLSGQPLQYLTGGQITIGATVAIGTIYVAAATAGGIAPSTDLASGWFTAIIGIATTAAIITVSLNVGGVAVP